MNSKKVLATSAAALAAVASLTPVATTQVEAADVIFTEIVFEFDGEKVTVPFDEFSIAMLNEEGDIYDLAMNNKIVSLKVSNGNYITIEDFAVEVLNNDGDKTVVEIMEELSTDQDTIIPQSEVETYVEFQAEEGIVPEVISID